MVLKKSNTRLNSGATQRVSKGRSRLGKDSGTCFQENTISMTYFSGVFGDHFTREQAFDYIFDYLEWNGPRNLHLTRVPTINRRLPCNVSVTYSLEKKKRWLLPDRIAEMVKDNDVRENLKNLINIRVDESQEIPYPLAFMSRKKEKTTELRSKENAKRKAEKQGRRSEGHCRGLQRRQNLSRSRSFSPEPETETDSELFRQAILNVVGPLLVDSRCVSKIKRQHKPRPSIHWVDYKPKGGLRREKKNLALDDAGPRLKPLHQTCRECGATDDDCGFDQESHDLKRGEFPEDDESIRDMYCASNCLNVASLMDFLHKPVKRKKKHKTQLKGQLCILSPVNSASIELIFKHSKGSYQYLETECTHPNANNIEIRSDKPKDSILMLSTTQTNSNDQDASLNSEDKDNGSMQIDIVNEKTETSVEQAELDLSVFDQGKCFVSLVLPKNNVLDMSSVCHSPELTMKNNCNTLGGHEVLFGNCFPSTFSIIIYAAFDSDQKWRLNAQCRCDNWRASLQSEKNQEQEKTVCDRFCDDVDSFGHECISLDKLVQSAQHCVNSNSISTSNPTNVSYVKRKLPDSTVCPTKRCVWLDMKTAEYDNITLLPIDKAVQHISPTLCNQEQAEDFNKCVSPNNMQYADSEFECGICFCPCDFRGKTDSEALMLLPCQHTFCRACWQAHVYHSITTGHTHVTCMESGCKAEVSQPVFSSLLSSSLVRQLCQRTTERLIETNPSCRWCPSVKCNLVAINKHHERDHGNGKVVKCLCKKSWCFSCQKDPHWPATCDQMSVFWKLHSKHMSLPEDSVAIAVKTKTCPRCKYPIEKWDGCPYMVCGLCDHNFCWQCLRPASTHMLYYCPEREDNFKSHTLENKLSHKMPIRFYRDFFDTHKDFLESTSHKTHSWLKSLHKFNMSTLKRIYFQTSNENLHVIKERAVATAEDCVAFSMQSYALAQTIYVVLSFVDKSKSKKAKGLIGRIRHLISIVRFVCQRLEHYILHQHLVTIYKNANRAQTLLDMARQQMSKLVQWGPFMQHLSKNIDTTFVDRIDPEKHFRYK